MLNHTVAACFAHIIRLDDARQVVARLRATTPKLIPDVSYLRDQRIVWFEDHRHPVAKLRRHLLASVLDDGEQAG